MNKIIFTKLIQITKIKLYHIHCFVANELHKHIQQKGLGMTSHKNPITAQRTDQIQNSPKVIMGTGAGGSVITNHR